MRERPRGAAVWSLTILASVLLVFSITANWVQVALLDTDEVVSSTDQIVENQDIQEALSNYAVEQLYANVDVEGQLQEVLPSSVDALATPVVAATRPLAVDQAERALDSVPGWNRRPPACKRGSAVGICSGLSLDWRGTR